jgi:hypothetical protein
MRSDFNIVMLTLPLGTVYENDLRMSYKYLALSFIIPIKNSSRQAVQTAKLIEDSETRVSTLT